MLTISVRQANQNFSHYLSLVERGEDILITKRGRSVARLLPVLSAPALQALGAQARFQEIGRQLEEDLARFPRVNHGGPYPGDDVYD